jgi:hypothetical protein
MAHSTLFSSLTISVGIALSLLNKSKRLLLGGANVFVGTLPLAQIYRQARARASATRDLYFIKAKGYFWAGPMCVSARYHWRKLIGKPAQDLQLKGISVIKYEQP